MKRTIDYSKSSAPVFDAVEDIKAELGVERYDLLRKQLSHVKNQVNFASWCGFVGIEDFPVQALYNSIHGGTAWVFPKFEVSDFPFYGRVPYRSGTADVYLDEIGDRMIVRISDDIRDDFNLPYAACKKSVDLLSHDGMVASGSSFDLAVRLIESK